MLENFLLGVELADFVMKQRVLFPFAEAGSATDDKHGRFFSERFGCRVGDFEAADAISDAKRAETAHARIGIRGKAGTLFVAGVDELKFAVKELIVKAEDVIAGNAEDVPDAKIVQAVN